MSKREHKPDRIAPPRAEGRVQTGLRGLIHGRAAGRAEAQGGVDPAWIRRRSQGALAMIAYIVVSIAGVCVGASLRIGPFGMLSGVELRLLGSESPVLSGALGLAVLALPIVWILRQPRDLAHPLMSGAQDALDPTRSPRFIPSPKRQLDTMRMSIRVSLMVAVGAIAGGGLGCFISQRPRPDAGAPLPTLTRDQLLAPGARLPAFARVIGLVDQPQAAWSYDSHVRRTHYRDAYIPLVDPSWRAGHPIDVLERDALLPDEPPGEENRFDPPGPREGAVHAGLSPWLVTAMRNAGMPLAAHVRVLDRQPLHGVVPGPDWISGFVWIDVAGSIAAVAGLMAWTLSRRLARLKAAGAPEGEG